VTGPLAVSANNLTRYYGDRAALEDVSFDIRLGDTLVVFGANGAGKTTLLRILATLVRPHSGGLRVLGEDIPKDSWAVRGRVGLIGHDPLVYRDLSARENLIFTARMNNVPVSEVDDILERVDLGGRADEPVRNFSKGMLQRLSTARAILPQPELLLLDEPRANLDPGAALLLEPFIGPARHRSRVIVTHDIEYGLGQADVALGLKRGHTEWLQPADRVSEAEARGLYK
jgi:heme exporter protein A